jgi:hypothetical protein
MSEEHKFITTFIIIVIIVFIFYIIGQLTGADPHPFRLD